MEQAFPGLDLRLLTLTPNFYLPFSREVLMALGKGGARLMSTRPPLFNHAFKP